METDARMTAPVSQVLSEAADLRQTIARTLALYGLGTVSGVDMRGPPNASWTQAEWERRVLQCVPESVEQQCYALADVIIAALPSDGLETEAAALGTGDKLLTIAREFIDKHHVSCAEATANDGVYEDAPLLVEALAEVAGYYSYPEDEA